MPPRNESIGTVECPHKACTEQCQVYRYRERGDSEKSVANRRFAGKLYGRCPRHGKFGGDPGEQDTQEYILNNATMHAPGAGDRQSSPAKSPAVAPAVAGAAAVTKRATPASSPAKPPATAPAAKPSNGLGWPWE